MELSEAIAQIAAIRAQIARAETFRGYRSVTVAATGLLAIAAGVAQALLISDPQREATAYLLIWISAAVLSLIATGLELVVRSRSAASPAAAQLTRLAVAQFLPCVLAGGVMTAALVSIGHEHLRLLPGLWALLFSLGISASCRLLPRPVAWIGVYYLFAGGTLLLLGPSGASLAPWAMAVTFGIGQFAGAAILYFTLERPHEPQ